MKESRAFKATPRLAVNDYCPRRLREALDPRRNVLMEGRTCKPVPMPGCGQFVGWNTMQKFLTFAIRIPQARSVWQCHMTGQHPITYVDDRLGARTLGNHADPGARLNSKFGCIYRAHPERAMRVFGTPFGIPDYGIGRA